SRCGTESEESTTTAATSRCTACRNTSVNRRRRCSLREANIENAAGCWIIFSSRTLLGSNLTVRLLLGRQDRATINQNYFDISLIVVGQHELRVRGDVERAEWSKIHRRGLIGACLDRRARQNRRTGVRAQSINGNWLIVPRRQSCDDLLRDHDWIRRVVWLGESDLKTNLDDGEK